MIALALVSSLLCASPLDAGIDRYAHGDLKAAREEFQAAIQSANLDAKTDADARLYLAATLQLLKDDAGTRAVLRELFRIHPDAQVDPTIFLPELVTLAERERAEVALPPPEPPPAPSRTPAYVTGVTAGGTLAACGVFALLAISQTASSTTNDRFGNPAMTVPRADAQGRVDQINTLTTASVAAGAVSLGLAAATVYLATRQ